VEIRGAKHLYKILVKETQKLPEDAAKFYKDSIKRVGMLPFDLMLADAFCFTVQGYGQHADESDPERLEQIYQRAVQDAKWIVDKYAKETKGKGQ